MACDYTGRYKYRFKKHWFLRHEMAILEIEIKCIDFDPLTKRNEKFVFWRDANRYDLSNNSIINWVEYIPDTEKELK